MPAGHPAHTVRRAAVSAFGLIVVLHLLAVAPGLAVLQTIAWWMTAAALAVLGITLIWAVVSNQRVRNRRSD